MIADWMWRRASRRLHRVLPPETAAAIIGDLFEDYTAHRRAGAVRAARWLRREARSLERSYRGAASTGVFASIGAECRIAVRSLRRRPGFSVAAVLILGLGLGAAAASWSIFDALLLRPLDYPQAERLLLVSVHLPGEADPGASISFQESRDLAERVPALDAIAGYWDTDNLQSMTPGGPVAVRANFVQGPYFQMLGATPLIGRLLDARDDRAPGQHPVVVISERFWRTSLSANASVLGSALRLNNRPFTVVGVVKEGFRDVPFEGGGEPAAGLATDVWVPAMMVESAFSLAAASDRGVRLGYAVGRVREGHTLAEVRAELAAAGAQLEQTYPQTNQRIAFWADPLAEWMFQRIRQPLRVVLGGSLVLLLVGALNVGGLLLVRQRERAHELTVRRALGASRVRLLISVSAESACLSVASALLAAPIAITLLGLVRTGAPLEFPRLQHATFDAPAALVLVVLAAVCTAAIAAMAAPTAWRMHSIKPATSRSLTADRRTIRFQHSVVVAEVALAAVLLVCGALVVGSLIRLNAKDVGFATDRLLTMKMALRSDRYRDDAAVAGFVRRVTEETAAIPGAETVTLWGPGRPGRSTWIMYPVLEADAGKTDPDRVMVWRHNVTAGALAAVGIPVLRGRDFQRTDVDTRPYVVIISESMARRFWPGRDPIGQRFTNTGLPRVRPWFQVIGVAADAAHRGRLATLDTPDLDFYQLLDQRVERSLTLVARLAGPAEPVVPELRAAIARVDPELALQAATMMSAHLAAESAGLRFASILLSSYAVLAGVLAAFGIYALVSYLLVLQRRDLALRQVLGATASALFRRQLTRGLLMGTGGTLLGMGAAFFASTLIRDALFDVNPRSPVLYLATALVVLTSAVLATAIPARRILRIDSVVILHGEN